MTAEQEELPWLRAEIAPENGAGDPGKGDGLVRQRIELKYQFIAREKKAYPVALLCRILDVSRTGFYDFQRRRQRPPDGERAALLAAEKQIAESSHCSYGSRRMARALGALGYPMGRDKARRLMREAGVIVRYRKWYRVTTSSDHSKPVFSNRLERDFAAPAPNRKWVADMTYV